MKKLITTLSIFLSTLIFTISVFACTPGMGSPWFLTHTTFDTNTLPPGITITSIAAGYPNFGLSNSSNIPLYIVKQDGYGSNEMIEIPEGYRPEYKLVSGNVYYWSYGGDIADSWKLNGGGINNTANSKLELGEGIYTLPDESLLMYGDDRPADVKIPDPQPASILTIYQGRPWEIKGTTTYSLNESYDPKARQKGIDACNAWSVGAPVFGIIFSILPLLLLGGIIFLIYKLLKFIIQRVNKKSTK